MSDDPDPDGATGDVSRGTSPSEPDAEAAGDAVRSALNRAKAAARARGLTPTPSARGGRGSAAGNPGRRPRRWDPTVLSGARPDGRDPQTVGATVDRLVADRGWQAPVAVGGVIGRWEAVVGAEIAAHCTPEAFIESVLTVRADSTAWATQLRLLLPQVMRRLTEEVGEDVVTKIVVLAPTSPSWRRGPRSAPGGVGPRDTYG